MKRTLTDFCLFSFGYTAYSAIELCWRRYTHFTMGIAGGLCFLMLYRLYRRHRRLNLACKCLLGAGVITAVEFLFGCLLNLYLRLDIWDYSDQPLNLLGQICPLFSLLWMLLCIPIVFLSGKIARLEDRM